MSSAQSLENFQVIANDLDLHWAPMPKVIGEKRMDSTLEKVKYGIRYFLSRGSRTQFLLRVSRSEFGRSLFEKHPTNFYVPLRSYLDNRFTVKERFDACIQDVETAKVKFGEAHANYLLAGHSISLIELGAFSVHLQMNRVSQHEGFWAITLHDNQHLPIANLSFGFLNQSTLLIASIQGTKDNERNILELNKRLTKEAFGLRPQNLLIATLQSLCNSWRIDDLIGIDPKHQVKRKQNTARQGFKFDYAAFWNELGALRNFSGYWSLTTQLPLRELQEVPSHKRSQYRKRNELLNQLNLKANQLFSSN
jgi:uncharacterized protein VirK/YbjX